MKNRYLQHADGPTFTIPKPSRKDYGSEFPVVRRSRSMKKGLLALILSGAGAILCFFALLVITFHLLPGAIEAELQRQVAVVERHLGVSK